MSVLTIDTGLDPTHSDRQEDIFNDDEDGERSHPPVARFAPGPNGGFTPDACGAIILVCCGQACRNQVGRKRN